ncbi:MAG: transglutaminase domain-containing protein, partial [Candidatus Electrothrix sp. AR4]|nr:transglutaminase domain-containing protein [Candidatus Electrothrix sp. AR4]
MPPLFLGTTLIFWGWQTDLLLPAVAMALVLEASRSVKTKWDLSLSDFNRIADICTILLACLVVFVVTTTSITSLITILKWLPVIFFPLLTAQEYSVAGKIDIRSLMLTARKKVKETGKPQKNVQLSSPYTVLCILSAGTANVKDGSFYLCLMLLAAWAAWPYRSKRFSPVWWFVLLVTAGGLGYVGHIGLYRLQSILMDITQDLLYNTADPFRRSTSIGDIGEMKLSDRIVFRIIPGTQPFNPILVRQASYTTYRGSTWYATPAHFTPISPEADQTTWKLGGGSGRGEAFTVWSPLKNGAGMLQLPIGTFQVENLRAGSLKQTPLGAVKVEEGPGLISYTVKFKRNTSRDLPPAQTDLTIPPKELAAVEQIANELRLRSKPPKEAVAVLDTFFQKKFSYSLKQDKADKGKTSLATFLLSSRSGHCEYFATASVLILRASGIPARYASGYSAHEFSKLENKIVVRKRHAHAWTLVYLDGVWRNLDTTSSNWINIEDEAAPTMHIFQDLWFALLFKVSQWRWGIDKEELKQWWWLLLAPLAIILGRRLYVKKKIQRIKTSGKEKTAQTFSRKKDSAFYRIVKRLNE